jgi:transposase
MRRRRPRRRPFDPGIPPEILPPDFVTRHDLHNYLYFRPTFGLTPAQPWAPLTDAEWAALRPILAEHGCGVSDRPRAGRPMADARGRLDAIFRAVTLKRPRPQGGGRAPWKQLPEAFGKSDTVSRTYRRWCRTDLWMRLLQKVGEEDCPEVLARLTHRICCAFRRGIRIMGMRAIVMARRLRLYSALPAPSFWLPDPDLSEIYMPVILGLLRHAKAHWRCRLGQANIRLISSMHRAMGGRARIAGWMEPP